MLKRVSYFLLTLFLYIFIATFLMLYDLIKKERYDQKK